MSSRSEIGLFGPLSFHGRVEVQALRSEGEVAGEIHAETVELAGRVSDQTVINAKSLEVRLNQPDGSLRVTFGNCELNVGDQYANDSRGKKSETPVEESMKSEPVL